VYLVYIICPSASDTSSRASESPSSPPSFPMAPQPRPLFLNKNTNNAASPLSRSTSLTAPSPLGNATAHTMNVPTSGSLSVLLDGPPTVHSARSLTSLLNDSESRSQSSSFSFPDPTGGDNVRATAEGSSLFQTFADYNGSQSTGAGHSPAAPTGFGEGADLLGGSYGSYFADTGRSLATPSTSRGATPAPPASAQLGTNTTSSLLSTFSEFAANNEDLPGFPQATTPTDIEDAGELAGGGDSPAGGLLQTLGIRKARSSDELAELHGPAKVRAIEIGSSIMREIPLLGPALVAFEKATTECDRALNLRLYATILQVQSKMPDLTAPQLAPAFNKVIRAVVLSHLASPIISGYKADIFEKIVEICEQKNITVMPPKTDAILYAAARSKVSTFANKYRFAIKQLIAETLAAGGAPNNANGAPSNANRAPSNANGVTSNAPTAPMDTPDEDSDNDSSEDAGTPKKKQGSRDIASLCRRCWGGANVRVTTAHYGRMAVLRHLLATSSMRGEDFENDYWGGVDLELAKLRQEKLSPLALAQLVDRFVTADVGLYGEPATAVPSKRKNTSVLVGI